jgi:hypothetical protein
MAYKLSEKTPGVFSFKQMDELKKFISKTTQEIESSNNPRLIVLESWFIIDWFIRQFIISGINCYDLVSDKFDPHYQLLPNSFRECINILQDLAKSQKKLKPKQISAAQGFSSSLEFWRFIEKKSPRTYKKIQELTDEFQREKYNIPKGTNFAIGAGLVREKKSYRFVTEDWLTDISKIDSNWIALALKLNKARNYAAHSLNEEYLYESFGIKGKNKIEKLRNECLSLLGAIVGLIKLEDQ